MYEPAKLLDRVDRIGLVGVFVTLVDDWSLRLMDDGRPANRDSVYTITWTLAIGLIRTVVSIPHCGCGDRSSILRWDMSLQEHSLGSFFALT